MPFNGANSRVFPEVCGSWIWKPDDGDILPGILWRPIRTHAKQILKRDFHVKAVGMTLNRLAKQGLARRKGHVWFPVGRSFEAGEGREEEPIRV